MNLHLIKKLHENTEIINGHWLWKGTLSDGYGKVTYNGTQWLVSRLSLCIYLKLHYRGNWVACHICRETSCWNPLHIYQGTQSSNVKDVVNSGNHKNANKTHCPQGHEYNKENTYVDSRGKKNCRVCNGIIQRKIRARKSYYELAGSTDRGN